MSPEVTRQRVRRIAVALDASPHCLPGLALAAALAAALDAEIEGVFVEDTELIRLAGLPFLREFRAVTRAETALDAERLQRELRAAARQVRAHLERSASELGVACSFRVWRGDLEAEILGAALGAELFALGRIGRFAPLRQPSRVPSRLARPTELVVGVLFTGSPAAERALAIAAELGLRHKARLVVILQSGGSEAAPSLPDAGEGSPKPGRRRGDEGKKARRRLDARASAEPTLEERARTGLGAMQDQAQLISLDTADATSLAVMIRTLGIDLLILDETNPLLTSGPLWTSLETLGCPVAIGR